GRHVAPHRINRALIADRDTEVYPCGEGRHAVGGVKMRDAGLELELEITQDRCLTRLPRYWGAWNGGAGSASSRRLRCWRRQRRRERICRRSPAGTGYCGPRCTSGAAWLRLGLLACREPPNVGLLVASRSAG